MARPPRDFVRDFLATMYEHRWLSSGAPPDKYHRLCKALEGAALARCAEELFSRSPLPVQIPAGDRMRLVYLREIDGSTFPFLVAVPRRKAARSATCFLGHRFTPEIESALRFNLKHILDADRVKLVWSAQDLGATDLFADIVRSIRRADMCFFDTRATVDRPNVYIEAGIAYAFGVPTILAEYVGSTGEAAVIPSDFQGLFRIQYTTYEQLFRTFYFDLPAFMTKYRVRRRPIRRRKS